MSYHDDPRFDIRNPNAPTPPINSWAALAKGQTIGKKAVLAAVGIGGEFGFERSLNSSVNLLGVQSDDSNSLQLNLTLSPPRFVFSSPALLALVASGDIQGITGEVDNQSPGFSPIILADASVEVEWGIGGVNHKVKADFLNGLCLNFSASFLRVSANISSMGIASPTNAAYVLAAFLGPGYPKARNAQRSIAVGAFTDPATFSAVFPVPNFSKAVTLVGMQEPGADNPFSGVIQFFRANVVSAASMISRHFFDETTHDAVNIPNGSFFFRVRNDTPTPGFGITRATAIFDLSV